MKQYIGIDLGGTGIKGAVVREDGEILARQTCPTRPQRGPAAVAEDMAAIEALDGGESLFFSHYDPKTVEWFMSIL